MGIAYDAFLLVSFGGPEKREEVMPFLENVTRGRNIPPQRLREVAQHYYQLGGKSPLNDQNRALIAALENELATHGVNLPIYWGNRNWHPLLPDTLRQMQSAGVNRAIAFFTSAFSSYSGCRQYLENIAAAQEQVGAGAPQVDRLRMFFNHPGFIEPMIEHTQMALAKLLSERQNEAHLVFTAHSIPVAMTENCEYASQLREACSLVAEGVRHGRWRLAYQSRSGPPSQPWLEPDVNDVLKEIARDAGSRDVIVVPIGFISDHLEVLYDLDEEARRTAKECGLNFVRAATVGSHPRFVQMIRELVQERMSDNPQRQFLGNLGPSHDVCPEDCCHYEPRRGA